MSCSTVKRWLNTQVSGIFADSIEETGGAEALDGETRRLRRRGRVVYTCGFTLRQGRDNPYMSGKCVSPDRRRAFRFDAGS